VLFLKFRRIELDLTCREVAKQAGLGNAWYGQIERGRVNPTADELKRIGKALKCAPERLMMHVDCTPLGVGAEHRDAQRECSIDGRARS
jgi:transcriptional regulator with XRE-family HTH domain